MTRSLLTWLICYSVALNAQSVGTLMGARIAGSSVSTVLADESSLFNNVGTMSSVTSKALFFAHEVSPGLMGASRTAFAILLPMKPAAAGIGLFRFGDELYSEQVVSLGLSHRLGSTSIGAKINYIQLRAQGFGTKSALSVTFGGLTRITPYISIGAYIVNLPIASLSDEQPLPAILAVGIGYKPGEHVFIGTEIEKNLDFGATWRSGIEYSIHKRVFARAGLHLNPNAACLGFGGRVKSLKFDYAVKASVILGVSHQVSCSYAIRVKNRKK